MENLPPPRREPEPLDVTSAIPIACVPTVFTAEERAAHLDLSVDAVLRWPLARHEVSDGYVFEYQGNEERFLALARWVAGEHRCCPWAGYAVEMGPFSGEKPGTIRVRVRTTPEGMALLQTCYDLLEKLRGGVM